MMMHPPLINDFPAFSAVNFAIKGNNSEQIFKAIAFDIAKLSEFSIPDITQKFEDCIQNQNIEITDGVAIFDWKDSNIKNPIFILSRLEHGVSINSNDNYNVDIIVTLISPEQHGAIHLRNLARIARFFHDTAIINKLRDTTSKDGMIAVINDALNNRYIEPAFKENIAA